MRKILLVRNDNIGDLVCSVPAIQLIRERLPEAKIDLLVNSYNAPVAEALAPQSVNRLVVYHKTKHVGLDLRQLGRLLAFYYHLAREGYDAVVIFVGGEQSPERRLRTMDTGQTSVWLRHGLPRATFC